MVDFLRQTGRPLALHMMLSVPHRQVGESQPTTTSLMQNGTGLARSKMLKTLHKDGSMVVHMGILTQTGKPQMLRTMPPAPRGQAGWAVRAVEWVSLCGANQNRGSKRDQAGGSANLAADSGPWRGWWGGGRGMLTEQLAPATA